MLLHLPGCADGRARGKRDAADGFVIELFNRKKGSFVKGRAESEEVSLDVIGTSSVRHERPQRPKTFGIGISCFVAPFRKDPMVGRFRPFE